MALNVSEVMEMTEVKTDMEILHGNVEPHNHSSKEIINALWNNDLHHIIKQLNAFLLLRKCIRKSSSKCNFSK